MFSLRWLGNRDYIRLAIRTAGANVDYISADSTGPELIVLAEEEEDESSVLNPESAGFTGSDCLLEDQPITLKTARDQTLRQLNKEETSTDQVDQGV